MMAGMIMPGVWSSSGAALLIGGDLVMDAYLLGAGVVYGSANT